MREGAAGMKLIDPTDDELNAAFAEKVAGWKRLDCCLWDVGYDIGNPWCRKRSDGVWISNHAKWTRSADAVLPWLEKRGYSIIYRGGMYDVRVYDDDGDNEAGRAYENCLPRAAVIALLRAHGIEVEFIK